MPQRDAYHQTVVNALYKDGWTITDDPYTIDFEDVTLFADLAAERTVAAEKGSEKIAIEIKMLGAKTGYEDIEKAFGQYQIYRAFIRRLEPERTIYLAVSLEAKEKVFSRNSVKILVADFDIKLVIFNPVTEEIVEWIN